MKRPLALLATLAAVAGLVAAGCTQAAPAPAPTKAPAVPTAAPAAPTKAPAAPTAAPAAPTKAPAAPTTAAAPAKKIDYPTKGKAISIFVGYAAGGGGDITARSMAPYMEKELGVPVEVVNKPGASTQLSLEELTKARPDGHTLALANAPANIMAYLDPERKATFGRKDFRLVANWAVQPVALAVLADGPYKTLDDLVKAAKAKPGQVKVSDAGLLNNVHMGLLLFAKEAGVKFASVHFDSGGAALTALLGEHVDAGVALPLTYAPQVKAGKLRILGITQKERSVLLPDLKTMWEQGYKVELLAYYGIMVPTGTPEEIVDLLASVVKKTTANAEFKQKQEGMGQEIAYLGPKEFTAVWDQQESMVPELIRIGRSQ